MRCLRAANGLLRTNATPNGVLPRTAPSLVLARRPGRLGIDRPLSCTARCHGEKAPNNGNKNNHNHRSSSSSSSSSNTPKPQPPTSDVPPEAAERPEPNPQEAFNLGDLTYAFDRAERRFAEELKRLRAGGRFNADVIGAVPVQPDRRSPQTFPLRELATVAPLGGRRWSILAFDEASVKAIVSAVQRSDDFNQQPQRSADNPLELTMTVEPERADALARRARDVCQAWRTRVRDEAHRRAELHKRWRAERLILSDDMHRLRKVVQEMQDERMKTIAAKEKEVVQQIMARAS